MRSPTLRRFNDGETVDRQFPRTGPGASVAASRFQLPDRVRRQATLTLESVTWFGMRRSAMWA